MGMKRESGVTWPARCGFRDCAVDGDLAAPEATKDLTWLCHRAES